VVAPSAGGIVLVPFPFSDLSQAAACRRLGRCWPGRLDPLPSYEQSVRRPGCRSSDASQLRVGLAPLRQLRPPRQTLHRQPGVDDCRSRRSPPGRPRAAHRRGGQGATQRRRPLKTASRSGRRTTAFTRRASPAGDAERYAAPADRAYRKHWALICWPDESRRGTADAARRRLASRRDEGQPPPV
jgi:hypothetical protein